MGKDGAGISGDEHAHKTESLLSGRNRSAANPFFWLRFLFVKSWTLQDSGTGTQDGRTMDSRRDGPGTQDEPGRPSNGTKTRRGLGLSFFLFLFPFV